MASAPTGAQMEVIAPITSTGQRLADQASKYSRDLYKQKLRDIKQLSKDTPVTILNMNPFPLKINGGVLFPDEVPACEPGQPYAVHVLREIRWQCRDNGCDAQNMMQMEPIPYVPLYLASEYIREYMQAYQAMGGVMCYIGDTSPALLKPSSVIRVPEIAYEDGETIVDIKERLFGELFAIVKTKRNEYLIAQLQESNSWYENDDLRKAVNDRHRAIARLAMEEGLISELPRWVLQANLSYDKQPDPCPSCQGIPKAGAIICVNCGYVFDVVECYRVRPSACPYGSVEMDRLTAEQWVVVNKIKAERDKARGAKAQ